MKKFLIVIVTLLLLFKIGIPQSEFYYTPVGKVYLKEISNSKILVKFRDDLSISKKNEILKLNNALKQLNATGNHSKRFNIIKVTENLSSIEILELLDELRKNPDIIYANPYYISESGNLLAYTNQIAIKLLSGSDYEKLVSLVESLNLLILHEDKYTSNLFYLEVPQNSTFNTLEVANYLFETGLFEFSEPNFVRTLKIFSERSYDPYFNSPR